MLKDNLNAAAFLVFVGTAPEHQEEFINFCKERFPNILFEEKGLLEDSHVSDIVRGYFGDNVGTTIPVEDIDVWTLYFNTEEEALEFYTDGEVRNLYGEFSSGGKYKDTVFESGKGALKAIDVEYHEGEE